MSRFIRRIPIWLLGVYLTLALFSYNSNDSCFNVVGNQEVKNLGGKFGAYTADILLQSIGIVSGVLIMLIFIPNSREQRWYFRFPAIMLLLTSTSCFLTVFPVHRGWQWDSYGGASGLIIKNEAIPYLGHIGFIFSSFSLSLLLFLYLFNFDWGLLFGIRREKEDKAKPRITKEITPKFEFTLPDLNFLDKKKNSVKRGQNNVEKSQMLHQILSDFGIEGQVIKISNGPVVTLYELRPAAGIKSSRIISLAGDIARSMSALSARIAVIPGRNAIGIELPNEERETVFLRELFESVGYRNTNLKLPVALGHDIGGKPVVVDLAKMPHLLVAGTTGSGKSVAINSMILSLLYRLNPDQCKFIMIDPKMLELSVYDGIPHLLSPVVTNPKKAVMALRWVLMEMENRYGLMSGLSVRNIEGYNKKISAALQKDKSIERKVQTGFDKNSGSPVFEKIKLNLELMPFIVVVVDEMADLMLVAGKDIESSIQRLAQMARAAGIHIIMATQRPSVDVITGVIKANFPTRISFSVTSKIDSRTILGEQGAEQLLGMGDMLYMASGGIITRVHGPLVTDNEVQNIANYLKSQGKPEYVEEMLKEQEENDDIEDGEEGDLYNQAVEIIKRDKKVSISYIQRQLRIGYNKAANIVEAMEKKRVVSPPNGTGKREILI
ncbi:MAG: DNA translocase FtsK 4TM domain-containing protein [Rickettsiaceae bacterium H1]|nr:DNA translocase FtsK 4TM domain-containing protein [Rickettsiaceae bacterium H1]